MFSFDFLDKGLGKVFAPHLCTIFQATYFLCYIPLTDQFHCLIGFLRYWATSVSQLFINQFVTSYIFNQAIFLHDQKVKRKI